MPEIHDRLDDPLYLAVGSGLTAVRFLVSGKG